MKKLLLALLLCVVSLHGQAQSLTAGCNNPPPGYGTVWTPGQWTLCLSSLQPYLGYTPVNRAGDVMQGKLTTTASVSGSAGFSVPQGTAPSSPANGDMWMTSSGLYFRVAGVTVGPINSSGLALGLTSGHIFVGNGSNVATDTAMSGGATISNTGVVTLTQFGNSTPGAVPASGGGTTNFLRADQTWAAPVGTTAANPTATAGPAANNGVATTFMRSDASPAVQKATSSQFGLVEPDNVSTFATSGGVLYATPHGFTNVLRNSSLIAWFHGTTGTITTSGGWSAEGVYVIPTGASVTYAQASHLSGVPTYNALQIVGNTGVTDVPVRFPVESYSAAKLAGNVSTFQITFANNTGGSITPTLTAKYAGSQDNWSAPVTDLAATNLQACANGATCVESYTLNVSANAINGYEFVVDFGNNFSTNGKLVTIGSFDARATPSATVGLNSSPPKVETRDPISDLQWCARFYQTSYVNGTAPGTATETNIAYIAGIGNGTNGGSGEIRFPVEMRAAPTVSFWDGAGSASKATQRYDSTFHDGFAASLGPISTREAIFDTSSSILNYFVHYAADASIIGG